MCAPAHLSARLDYIMIPHCSPWVVSHITRAKNPITLYSVHLIITSYLLSNNTVSAPIYISRTEHHQTFHYDFLPQRQVKSQITRTSIYFLHFSYLKTFQVYFTWCMFITNMYAPISLNIHWQLRWGLNYSLCSIWLCACVLCCNSCFKLCRRLI